MRNRTSARLAMLLTAACLAVALAACGSPPPPTVWYYDLEATKKHAEPETHASLAEHLKGVAVTLEFRGDNSFTMVVVGTDKPGTTEGSFRSGNGEMILVPNKVNGAAVPNPAAAEVHLRAPDSDRIEMKIAGVTAVLIRKRSGGP